MPRRATKGDYLKVMGFIGILALPIIIVPCIILYLVEIVTVEVTIGIVLSCVLSFIFLLVWNVWRYVGTWTLTESEREKTRNRIRSRLERGNVVSVKDVEEYLIGEFVEKSDLSKQSKSRAKNEFTKYKYAEKFLISLTSRRSDFFGQFSSIYPRRLEGAKLKELSGGEKAVYYPERA